jgi:hypothetical protein
MGRVTAAALPDVPCPSRTRQELIVAGYCLAGRRCCPGLRSSCAARPGEGVMAVDNYPVYTTALAISRSARQAPNSGNTHDVGQIQH